MNKKTYNPKQFIIVIALLLLHTGIVAQSYFSLILPQGQRLSSARSLSMGMSGVATSAGIDNLWMNPAMLSTRGQLLTATINGSLRRFEEKRSYPVMDMFDDVVTENVYAANRFWYPNMEGGLVAALPMDIHVGLAQSTFWDFNYDYAEEIRGSLPSGTYNRDPVRGYHEIQRSGKIMATNLGFSASLIQFIKLGASVQMLSGKDIQDRYAINVLEPDDALASDTTFNFDSNVELDGNPMMFTLGAVVQPTHGLTVGFSYQSGVEIVLRNLWSIPTINERTQLPGYWNPAGWDTTGYTITTLPEKFVVGIEAKMKNPIATKAVLELHYTNWSEFKVEAYPPIETLLPIEAVPYTLQETWEIHGGIEHVFYNKIPFRFGFIFSESPLGQEFETTRITLGSAYQWGNATFDFGIVFGSLSYRYEDLFIAVSEEIPHLDTVKESNAVATFTLKYAL